MIADLRHHILQSLNKSTNLISKAIVLCLTILLYRNIADKLHQIYLPKIVEKGMNLLNLSMFDPEHCVEYNSGTYFTPEILEEKTVEPV